MRKFLSLLLTFLIVISMLVVIPISASAVSIDPNKAYVLVNNQYYEVKKGDVFTYTHNLQYDTSKILALDVRVDYDTEGLDFIPAIDEFEEYDMLTMFPVLGDAVVYNFKVDGTIIFNYSSPTGKKFTPDNSVVFCGQFEVTADTGVYAIDGRFETLADKDMTKLVYKGEVLSDNFVEDDFLPELTPVDMDNIGETEPTIETSEPTEYTEPTFEPSEDNSEPDVEPTEPPVEYITFYLYNSAKWETVCAFPMIELDDTDALWPGEQMKYVGTTADGVDVHEITFESKYKYVVFSDQFNTENENITGELEIQAGKFYDNSTGEWLDSVEYTPTEATEAPLPTEPSEAPDGGITVYLINSANWTQQNIYLWNDDEGIAQWPGLAMVYTGETAYNGAAIFKFTYDKYYKNVIFNNGVDAYQTPDMLLENGKYYDNLDGIWYDSPDFGLIDPPTIPTEPSEPTQVPDPTLPTEPSEIPSVDPPTEPTETPDPPEKVKVYLCDEAGWGGSHVYVWSDSEELAAWPGVTMTYEGSFNGDDIFSFEFDKAYDNIIFNNGGGIQTDDLVFVAGGVFNNATMEWIEQPVNPSDPTEPTQPSDTPVDPTPSEPTVPSEPTEPSEKPGDSEGDPIMGDINGDGQVTVFDATILQRFIAKMQELTDEQKLICDLDADGDIKVFDATIIQRIVAKKQ